VDYPGIDGFLRTRASIMLDVVFLAMWAVLPVLFWSIWQVKVGGRFALHKRVQLGLGATLAVAIVLFEIDMRLISGWRQRAEPSPYYGAVESAGPVWNAICLQFAGMDRVPGWVFRALAIHLVFAVSTAILWTWTIVRACQRFAKPPTPNEYSRVHRRLGWLAAIDMTLTSVSGWVFYWLAFVA
jgi:putative membrane protein